MYNIILFIRRYFNFLFFVVLQIISLVLLVKFNQTHEAAYGAVANEVTGLVNVQYNKVQYFFHLKETNRKLQDENARLRNLLGANFENADTIKIAVIDSLANDTLGLRRKFLWLPAKVVSNTISSELNFLTLHRGALQGVKKDMAVIGPDGVVGIVIDVSQNYCRVMSVLNRNSRVSSMLKNGSASGSVEWDGRDPRYLTLKNIPKSLKVSKGDSVITSYYSVNFPPNIMVGTVHDIAVDPGSNFFTIRLRTATNFYSIQYAYIVENLQWEEQRRLEAGPLKNP
jgi:rod shape-determining protein MreC